MLSKPRIKSRFLTLLIDLIQHEDLCKIIFYDYRWLLAEAFGISDADKHRYYDARSTPFFFDLVVIKRICSEINAACIRNIIKRGVNLTDNEWPNFVVSTQSC